jgi:hypothetical protein
LSTLRNCNLKGGTNVPAEFFYFPFDDGPGADSEENRWEDMMQYMRTTGVLIPWDQTTLEPATGDLAVTANGGLSVQTAVGEAWIHGFMFQQQDDYYSIAISANSSGDPRIDLLTARLDTDANTIVYHVEEGTPDPSPVAPTPVESDPIWDLSLAEIYVADGAVTILAGDITDTRVISVQASGSSSAVTLASGTGDESLVADGVGPDLEIKAITAGPNISLTSDGDQITIEATGAGSSVTLASAGGVQTLVSDGVGPDLEVYGLTGGTNIAISESMGAITIDGAATPTLTNAGTTSLVNDGTGPALATKGLVAGTNISFSTSATDITIAASSTPTNSPICVLRRNANLTVNNAATPIITWTTAVTDPYSMWNGTTTITIAEDGWYAMTLNIRWTGDASANGSLQAYITKVGTTLALSQIMMVGSESVSNNLSTIANLVATDAITVVVTNSTGVNLTMPSTGSYTPVFSLWKIRS